MRSGKLLAGLSMAVFALTGCQEEEFKEYSTAPLSQGDDHDHDHGHEGKHGGHVLELDDAHGYHAEMVFDTESRDITLYIYGSEIGVAKAATDLEFEIEKDGEETALEAKASPLDGETEETASRFVIAGSQLPEGIKSDEQLDGHFHVTIDGKELVGHFHPHSHGDADHGHEAHEGEEHHGEGDKDAEHEAAEEKGDEHKGDEQKETPEGEGAEAE